mmetsp:Transcript_132309/g.282930  ORF Transcript_132309/g.282930 Transcript_132309/m.282930 type:complete len:213 (+) Transcript_132309:2291-2929(+)
MLRVHALVADPRCGCGNHPYRGSLHHHQGLLHGGYRCDLGYPVHLRDVGAREHRRQGGGAVSLRPYRDLLLRRRDPHVGVWEQDDHTPAARSRGAVPLAADLAIVAPRGRANTRREEAAHPQGPDPVETRPPHLRERVAGLAVDDDVGIHLQRLLRCQRHPVHHRLQFHHDLRRGYFVEGRARRVAPGAAVYGLQRGALHRHIGRCRLRRLL